MGSRMAPEAARCLGIDVDEHAIMNDGQSGGNGGTSDCSTDKEAYVLLISCGLALLCRRYSHNSQVALTRGARQRGGGYKGKREEEGSCSS